MLQRVQDENDVLEILERLKVPAEVKADAWDAYSYSPNETSFTERMKKLTLPEDIKPALWDRRWANKQPQPK
jgi:hypothetical protein